MANLFTNAGAIQRWLAVAARLICKSSPGHRFIDNKRPEHMTPVIWTSPLGLPIVQPYRKHKRKQVRQLRYRQISLISGSGINRFADDQSRRP